MILTTAANDAIKDLHDHMPVIVPQQLFDPWLAGENVALGPYPAGAMKVQPVSMLVNNPRMKSIDAPPGLAQRLHSALAPPRMSKATLVPANARAPTEGAARFVSAGARPTRAGRRGAHCCLTCLLLKATVSCIKIM